MAVTIADLQTRYRERLEQKKRGAIERTLLQNLSRFAVEGPDGAKFITAESLKNSTDELSHDLLKKEEADFLFAFWDTMAGKQEATGFVPIELAVYDIKQSQEQYGTAFRSGDETLGKGGGGNKSNVSSLGSGGIFGGGSYEADARSDRGPIMAGAPPMAPMQQPASPSGRPRGNQSSIQGGIFGENADLQPPPSSRSNRSNQSSIPGGIFGEGQPTGMPKAKKFDSNRSSIQGGIFG